MINKIAKWFKGLIATQEPRVEASRYKRWTEEDIVVIMTLDTETTDEELSVRLGRSINSIRSKRYIILKSRISNDKL